MGFRMFNRLRMSLAGGGVVLAVVGLGVVANTGGAGVKILKRPSKPPSPGAGVVVV